METSLMASTVTVTVWLVVEAAQTPVATIPRTRMMRIVLVNI
jgi:hypothetical protein